MHTIESCKTVPTCRVKPNRRIFHLYFPLGHQLGARPQKVARVQTELRTCRWRLLREFPMLTKLGSNGPRIGHEAATRMHLGLTTRGRNLLLLKASGDRVWLTNNSYQRKRAASSVTSFFGMRLRHLRTFADVLRSVIRVAEASRTLVERQDDASRTRILEKPNKSSVTPTKYSDWYRSQSSESIDAAVISPSFRSVERSTVP